ncbi:hypothetical protein N7495_002396 [Penicillium taxi]|uniref:uncharacterized protein n=1 Tax=Penicillium taxi TaxID=168475 RepID=UPI002544E34E|nr:uncharacterized protein N7495_002396 [Penicillium taxi]KAJ5901868.1 hypothetical protein N7495_002396 [Penicillium taxi]
MHFSTTFASAAMLVLGARAALPVASIEFQSWSDCPAGDLADGKPVSVAEVATTPVTCDKTPVSRQWNVDFFSFKALMDTKEAKLCSGVYAWNNDDCSGEPWSFLPFDGEGVVQGQCLPDSLDPTYLSFQLSCYGYY